MDTLTLQNVSIHSYSRRKYIQDSTVVQALRRHVNNTSCTPKVNET